MNRHQLETEIPNLILSGNQSEWTLQKIWEELGGKRNLILDVLRILSKKRQLQKRKYGRKVVYTIPESDPVQWQDLRYSIDIKKKESKNALRLIKKKKPFFNSDNTVNPKCKELLEYLSYEIDGLMIMYTRLSYAKFLNLADKKYQKIIQRERDDIEKITRDVWKCLLKEGKSFESQLKRFFGMRRRSQPFSIYPQV